METRNRSPLKMATHLSKHGLPLGRSHLCDSPTYESFKRKITKLLAGPEPQDGRQI